jgi:[ribosomal protein S18]-alanine N-acetyltransferase
VTHVVEPTAPTHATDIARIEATAASTRWSESAVRDTLERPETRGWLTRKNGDIVGHLLTRVAGDTAEVLTLAVLPSDRRQGRAGALLGRAETVWRTCGVAEGFLEVRASNSGALALYARHGWEEVGSRTGYYLDGEDAVVMRWNAQCGG